MDIQSIKNQLETLINPHTGFSFSYDKIEIRIKSEQEPVLIQINVPYPIKNEKETFIQLVKDTLSATALVSATIECHQKIIPHQVQPGVSLLPKIKNVIAVASGKGGVGKSTTAANIAIALHELGAKVGVLDADIYGPSQPVMLGVENEQPQQTETHFVPVETKEGIQVMSIGFLVEQTQAMVWRGPMVSQALQQLLFSSQWHDLDYLIVDLPPGTGDIQLTLSQKVPVTGVLVVTTPQDIALLDAKKAIDMFSKVNVPVLGVLENMSTHICSHCGHVEPIFGEGGGEKLAEENQVPLLGQLPLSLPIRQAMDQGRVVQLQDEHVAIRHIYQKVATSLALAVARKNKDFSSKMPKIVVE